MYHPKKARPNRVLWSIIAVILLLHVVGLAAFGGWTLYEAIRLSDPTFDEPPPVEKIERVKLEYKVRMQEQQKKTAPPKQKLQVQSIGNIAMPDVSIQVPNLGTTGDVGVFGSGNFGDLGDAGGLDVGGVSVELFEIEAKGEKFLFAIDVERNLMQDSKGGLPTYNVIKEDLTELIMGLPSGVLFNVMLFENGRIELWKPSLTSASAENKENFAGWLKPVNSGPDNIGIRENNYEPDSWNTELGENLQTRSYTSGNEVFLVAMGMLEQRPDAVYIFSDSLPGMAGAQYRTEEDIRRTEEDFLQRLNAAGFQSEEEYKEKRAILGEKIKEDIRKFKEREARQREKAGKPPRIYTGGENHQLRVKIEEKYENEDDYAPRINRQGFNSEYSEREMESFFERLMRQEYDLNAEERPEINAIIFKGKDEELDEEEDDNIDDFVDFFNGDYRVLQGLGAIETEEYQED